MQLKFGTEGSRREFGTKAKKIEKEDEDEEERPIKPETTREKSIPRYSTYLSKYLHVFCDSQNKTYNTFHMYTPLQVSENSK